MRERDSSSPHIFVPPCCYNRPFDNNDDDKKTTCRMLSKDWMNDKIDDGEPKKGKRALGYAGGRNIEHERL